MQPLEAHLKTKGKCMSERKYRYEIPRTHEQRMEAVYEELSSSPIENGHSRPTETLKDHVVALLSELRAARFQRKNDKDDRSDEIDWAQGALAVLAMGLLGVDLFGTPRNDDWLSQHLFAIRLWGVGFATIFLGVSIERTSFFRVLWSFGLTKLVASIALSGLVIFSTGKASGLVNSVFPVDASALPFTRAMVAGILAIKYAYPLMMVVGLFSLLHLVSTAVWVKKKLDGDYSEPPLMSMAFLVLSLTVFAYLFQWKRQDFSEEAMPAKVYRLAHLLDFNAKHECSNLADGQRVVFLGPEHSRVLVDEGYAQTDEIESFVNVEKSGEVIVPTRFAVMACDLSSTASTEAASPP